MTHRPSRSLRDTPPIAHDTQTSAALAAVVALAFAFAFAAVPARPAIAAGTSPTLLLAAADAFPGANGERLVAASGAFSFEDFLQVTFPAAGLMIVQGTRFARYEVDGRIVSATSGAVADGVTAAELPALLAANAPAGAPARLAHLDRDRVAVVLPAEFSSGTATVLLYAEHDDEHFVSNAIEVTLP